LNTSTPFELGPKSRARGVRLIAYEELASTNDASKLLVEEGERGPLWVVAQRQTKGRGRHGRTWISPPGNLYASLILSGEFSANLAPQLGFVAGVAAMDALREASRAGKRLALKWPNDLLLDRGKLGGVLLDGVAAPTGDPRVPTRAVAIVGVGINCASAPEGMPYPARALSELGGDAPSAPEVFRLLSDAFVAALDTWADGEGFAAIRQSWLSHAAGLGELVRIALTRDEELRGLFKSIDAGGRLVVACEGGDRAIDAGDVFLAHGEPTLPEGSGLTP
jgi:BirA family biotin operon repressor/biotin-[acetyl-CoA-carboxylase] ligase